MTRKQELSRQILGLLAEWNDPADEAVLHVAMEGRVIPPPLASEFLDTIKFCEAEGWITGVRNPLRGVRWAVTDKGRMVLRA